MAFFLIISPIVVHIKAVFEAVQYGQFKKE